MMPAMADEPPPSPPADAFQESLLARARAAVADKSERGVYTAEFRAMLDEPLEIEPDPAFTAGPSWDEAVRTAEVSADVPLVSTRPVIGPILRALKAMVRRSLRWYVAPVAAQVSTHNRAVVEVLAAQSREILELRREVDRLTRQLRAADPASSRTAPPPA